MIKLGIRLNRVIGIDIGSLKSHVVWKGKVVSLATVVTYRKKTRELVAVGDEAERMWRKVPSQLEVIRPVVRGRIREDEAVMSLLDYGIGKVGLKEEWWGLSYFWTEVVGVIDPGLNSVERRVIKEVLGRLGFRRIVLVDKILVGLVGHGEEVFDPSGKLVVYIGGETSHISLVSLGGKVMEISLEKGGKDVSYELVEYLRRRYGLIVSMAEVEKVKKIKKIKDKQKLKLRGFNQVKRKVEVLEVDIDEVDEVLLGAYSVIVQKVKQMLGRIPSEFLPEINRRGVVLMGGASWFRGLDGWLSDELGLPVRCEKGMDMIVEGLKKLVEGEIEISRFKQVENEG